MVALATYGDKLDASHPLSACPFQLLQFIFTPEQQLEK
jgi:hypothetical protein